MALSIETLLLDQLGSDPSTPPGGLVWYKDGLKPAATTSANGFMLKEDKNKLDNMSANGSGDDWVSGLLIEAQTSNDQTVKYALGTYMVNGVVYAIAAGGTYNLQNGYGGVNHYTALSAGQRAIVLIYVDVDQVIKSVAGAPTSGTDPALPTFPADCVCLAFVTIRKHTNGSVKNITPSDITDCRYARKPKLDELSKVSSGDTTSGFLKDKLSDNGNVHFTTENSDANETVKADVQFGATSSTACVGNDSRLSDDRTAAGLRSATTVVAVSSATAPSAGQVLTATAGNAANWQTSSGSADANAIHVNAGNEISAITEKTAPVAADLLVIEDSAASNIKKRVKIGNLPHANSEATATADTTTTGTSYAQMSDMTLTPGAGTYLALFSTSVSSSASNGMVYLCFYANNVQIASTESITSAFKAGDILDTALNKIVTVGAGQAIEVRWKVGSGTGTAKARVLSLVKIG